MKNIILVCLLIIIMSGSAFGQITAEDRQVCSIFYTVSENIMIHRQNGTPMKDMIKKQQEYAKKHNSQYDTIDELVTLIIIDAYKVKRVKEKYRQQVIDDFAAKQMTECLEAAPN